MHPPFWQFFVVALAGWINRYQQASLEYLREENRILRELLGKKCLLFTDDQRRRLAAKAKEIGRKALQGVSTLVTPETLLSWYRKLIARKYDGSNHRGPGRHPKPREIRELILQIARECPRWGYTRIQGVLRNLGHDVGRSTIKRVLDENGLDPAPERGQHMPWSTFLKAHWDVMAACDLFAVEVLTFRGLVRTMTFFVIDLSTRTVHVAGIAVDPTGKWMEQLARNLTDAVDGLLRGKRFLIHDRDPIFTEAFDEILRSVGITPVKLPPRSPNLKESAPGCTPRATSRCTPSDRRPEPSPLRADASNCSPESVRRALGAHRATA